MSDQKVGEGNKRSLLNHESSNGTSTEMEKHEQAKKQYTLYPMRWAVCIFFTTSVLSSGLGMVGFSAISPIIKNIYGVSDITVTLLVLPFIILFIPCIFPANYLIDKYGIVIPVYIASVCLLVGAWVRMFANVNFNFVLAGQVIMAIGQPFMLSAPAKLAAEWFGDNERAIATTLGSLAGPMGAVTGFLLPLPLIKDKDAPPDNTESHGEKTFFTYVLVQNIIITVLGLPIIFIVRNRPPTPPSASAAKALKGKKVSQFSNIGKILKDRDYLFLLISFSWIYSIYTTLGACVGPMSEKFGYGSKANSVFGTVYIFGGLFGSFVHAFLLDKYGKYKIQYLVIGLLCVISMSAVTAVIGEGSLALSSVCLAFLGLSQLPIIGVSYSFCAELTYPVNEALSCGFLQLSGSIVASVFTFAIGFLLDKGEKYIACYLMIGSVSLGFLFQFLVRERLRRKKAGLSSRSFSFHVGNTAADAVVEEQGKTPKLASPETTEI